MLHSHPLPDVPLHTQASPWLRASAQWLATVLEMFPRCADCGRSVQPGEAVALCRDNRRVRHEHACRSNVA